MLLTLIDNLTNTFYDFSLKDSYIFEYKQFNINYIALKSTETVSKLFSNALF